MNDFPSFMKQPMNRIPTAQQNTPDIDGYYYEGQDGSQICFWTYLADRDSVQTARICFLNIQSCISPFMHVTELAVRIQFQQAMQPYFFLT